MGTAALLLRVVRLRLSLLCAVIEDVVSLVDCPISYLNFAIFPKFRFAVKVQLSHTVSLPERILILKFFEKVPVNQYREALKS